jgi:hypothetical protein
MRSGFAVMLLLYWVSSTEFTKELGLRIPVLGDFLRSTFDRPPIDFYFRTAAFIIGALVAVFTVIYLIRDGEFRRNKMKEAVLYGIVWLLLYPASIALRLMAHL